MTPIRNQILAKPYPSDEISAGGIIVPDAYRAVSNKMLVVKVGNGTKERPMRIKAGETVFRVKDCGVELMINNERHVLIEDNAILAINE